MFVGFLLCVCACVHAWECVRPSMALKSAWHRLPPRYQKPSQSYKHPYPGSFPWKRALAAIDSGVSAMAAPGSRVPLAARNELLSGLVAVYSAQREAFDLEDLQALLKWLEAFVRYPLAVDDVTPVPGVLPPVQKAALSALGHICGGPIAPAAAWSDVLRTLAGLLCPFRATYQRRVEAEVAAEAAAAGAAAPGAGDGGSGGAGGDAAAAQPLWPPGQSSPAASPLARLRTHGSFAPGRAALLSPRSIGRAGRCGSLSAGLLWRNGWDSPRAASDQSIAAIDSLFGL